MMRKSTLRLICVVMSITLLLGILAFVSGLISIDEDKSYEYFGEKLNEKNLYTIDCVTLVDQNNGKGIRVDVDERTGAITIDGKAQDDMVFVIGQISLDAGTYTLTSYDDASYATVYTTADASSSQYEFDFSPANTIKLSGKTTLTLKIHISGGESFKNIKILPVIVPGDEAQDFYK